MRYLAIDYGNKRTGLAVCDAGETIVSPLAVIKGQKQLLQNIVELIKTENADAVVFGLPLNMDNSTGPQAKLVLEFASRLKKQIDIPIHFQDERLSSFGAEEKLAAADLTRKKKKEQ